MSRSERFLRHLAQNKPTLPLKICTFNSPTSGSDFEVVEVPKFGPFNNPAYSRFNRAADRYALWAFVFSFLEMYQRGFQWMTWVETDCRFSVPAWDERLFHALEDSTLCRHPVIGGTPVAWHAWSKGSVWSARTVEFAYNYQRASGVPMAIEGAFDGPPGYLLYPNGALALYWIPDLVEAFKPALELLKKGPSADQMEALAARLLAFDYYMGSFLVKKYGIDLMNRFAITPWVYSGCGEDHVTLGERINMLSRKTKAAVHQIKGDVYEW